MKTHQNQHSGCFIIREHFGINLLIGTNIAVNIGGVSIIFEIVFRTGRNGKILKKIDANGNKIIYFFVLRSQWRTKRKKSKMLQNEHWK